MQFIPNCSTLKVTYYLIIPICRLASCYYVHNYNWTVLVKGQVVKLVVESGL